MSASGNQRPLERAEVLAGRRLDSDHDPELDPRSTIHNCSVCRTSVDDSLGRPLRHLPNTDELSLVDAWLATHDNDESS